MTLAQESAIDILDRRHAFLSTQTGHRYLLHLIDFVRFLHEDPAIAPYTRQLVESFLVDYGEFERRIDEEIDALAEVRRDLARQFPEVDDSMVVGPNARDRDAMYEPTFVAFDQVLSLNDEDERPSVTWGATIYENDETKPAKLLPILQSKIDRVVQSWRDKEKRRATPKRRSPPPALDLLWARIRALGEEHRFIFREFINRRLTSPGQALLVLRSATDELNVQPERLGSMSELMDPRRVMKLLDRRPLAAMLYRPLDALDERTVQDFRIASEVAYEGIREMIGRLGARIQVVERYCQRATWYDTPRLRTIGRAEGEKGLTRDLALFLFDQGLPVITRVKLGVHELDVADVSFGRLLIEAKLYKSSEGHAAIKGRIVRGFGQVHAYLGNLNNATGIREAYLVVFRLGGPLIDMPEVVHTPRFSIYLVLVDLGEAIDSGSKQPKPIVVSEEELFATFDSKRKVPKMPRAIEVDLGNDQLSASP